MMRTVLWDLDGTLADTATLHYAAWQATMDHYGAVYDYAEFLAGFGRNNRTILSEKLGVSPDAPQVAEIAAHKEAAFRSLLVEGELELLPGVAEWLAALQHAGVRQMISSSGPMANIAAVVNKLAIGDYFLGLMSGATIPRGKPHPDLFLNSAAAAGSPVADCVVVEDSIHGIEAAAAAPVWRVLSSVRWRRTPGWRRVWLRWMGRTVTRWAIYARGHGPCGRIYGRGDEGGDVAVADATHVGAQDDGGPVVVSD